MVSLFIMASLGLALVTKILVNRHAEQSVFARFYVGFFKGYISLNLIVFVASFREDVISDKLVSTFLVILGISFFTGLLGLVKGPEY